MFCKNTARRLDPCHDGSRARGSDESRVGLLPREGVLRRRVRLLHLLHHPVRHHELDGDVREFLDPDLWGFQGTGAWKGPPGRTMPRVPSPSSGPPRPCPRSASRKGHAYFRSVAAAGRRRETSRNAFAKLSRTPSRQPESPRSTEHGQTAQKCSENNKGALGRPCCIPLMCLESHRYRCSCPCGSRQKTRPSPHWTRWATRRAPARTTGERGG
jgi:hypothetical protein